jgi:hypothetical protein
MKLGVTDGGIDEGRHEAGEVSEWVESDGRID